jgi:transposase-like protein
MAKTRAGKSATRLRRRRWTSKEAKKVLEAQAESGLTVSAFAAREGLSAHRLFRWRRYFGASTPKPPAFEEIVAVKAAPLLADPALSADTRLEIVLRSGLIVRVAESFNADALRRLLGVVDGGRSC